MINLFDIKVEFGYFLVKADDSKSNFATAISDNIAWYVRTPKFTPDGIMPNAKKRKLNWHQHGSPLPNSSLPSPPMSQAKSKKFNALLPSDGNTSMKHNAEDNTYTHPVMPNKKLVKINAVYTADVAKSKPNQVIGYIFYRGDLESTLYFHAPTASFVRLVNPNIIKTESERVVLCYFGPLDTVPCSVDNLFVQLGLNPIKTGNISGQSPGRH